MKVKVTHIMAKTLNKAIENHNSIETIRLIKMNINKFETLVNYNSFLHENDYNYKTELFSVLKVYYKADCYAFDKYITTNDLIKMFKHSDKTLNGFINEFIQAVEI